MRERDTAYSKPCTPIEGDVVLSAPIAENLVRHHHGTAMPAFLEAIRQYSVTLNEWFKHAVRGFTANYLPHRASGQTRRAYRCFVLVGPAGECWQLHVRESRILSRRRDQRTIAHPDVFLPTTSKGSLHFGPRPIADAQRSRTPEGANPSAMGAGPSSERSRCGDKDARIKSGV